MSKANNDDVNDEISKIKTYGWISFGIIVFVFLILCGLYWYRFRNNLHLEWATDPADWGSFGDYIGGILNPFIALFAFYWLISSIKTQVKELTDSREQFEDVSNKQQKQISIQNFESLFFQLMQTKTQVTEIILNNSQIEYRDMSIESNIVTHNKNFFSHANQIEGRTFKDNLIHSISASETMVGKQAIKNHVIFFKSLTLSDWEEFYTKALLDSMGSYFRLCYQIVKLIDKNEILRSEIDIEKGEIYSIRQKEYFDIFRSTLTQYELEAFFFNCLSRYGNDKFKKLIEKYGLFEPLLIDTDKEFEEFHRITRYAYQYNKNIFEQNDYFIEYFDDLKILENISIAITIRKLYTLTLLDIIEPIIHGEVIETGITFREFLHIVESDIFGYRHSYDFEVFQNGFFEYKSWKLKLLEKEIEEIKISIADLESRKKEYFNDIGSQRKYALEMSKNEKNINLNKLKIRLLNKIDNLSEIEIVVKYKINVWEFYDYEQNLGD